MSKQGFSTDGPNGQIGNIWLKYAPKIYKQCARQTNSDEAAKDLFQDVALKFCRNAPHLDMDASLEGWFRMVVRTTYCDQVRRVYVETPMSSLLDEEAEYNVFPNHADVFYNENVRKQRVQDLVSLFLKELTPAERVVVEGSFIAGVPLSAMSRDFGMPRCVLWRRRNEALMKLRNGKGRRLLDLENPDIPMTVLDKASHLRP